MRSTLFLSIALTACMSSLPDNVVQQDVDSLNGTSLNGTSLNGTSLNGKSLNGTSLNGTSLNGTSLNGTSLNGTSLNGTALGSVSYVGSTWTGTASNGVSVTLRIDGQSTGTGVNSDIGFYTVSYQTDAGWLPLCGVDASGVPIEAIAVSGVWDAAASYAPSSTLFTFACRFKSIAKCVELGYKTWKDDTNQMASCVRLLRADYCGTGVSYTVDGTLLNLYDNIAVQLDTESWDIEAEWTPAGARCITNAGSTRFSQASQIVPPCLQSLTSPSCGTFKQGALLIDELPPLSTSGTTNIATTTATKSLR